MLPGIPPQISIQPGEMNRLLFISNLFPDQVEPYRGLDNATVLHALRDRGWVVRVLAPRPWFPLLKPFKVFTPRGVDAPLQPQYVPYLYLPKIGSVANHRLLASALRRHPPVGFTPDALLASWLFPDGWAAWRSTHLPTVLLAQGSDVHVYLKSLRRRKAILEALNGTQACICRSQSLSVMLAAAGAETAKLVPLHNGIDTKIFSHEGSLPDKADVPTDAPVLLFVGNLLPVKNPEFLLRAFAKLSNEWIHPAPHLVIAGKGAMREALESLAAKLGIPERIHFLGPQTAPEIAAWMRRAQLLVMTSVNEGLPNVILEAQACGLQVVATDVGGIHEVVDQDWKGRLTAHGDMRAWINAVAEMLQKPSMRAQIAEIGNGRTWASVALAYEQVIQKARSCFHQK